MAQLANLCPQDIKRPRADSDARTCPTATSTTRALRCSTSSSSSSPTSLSATRTLRAAVASNMLYLPSMAQHLQRACAAPAAFAFGPSSHAAATTSAAPRRAASRSHAPASICAVRARRSRRAIGAQLEEPAPAGGVGISSHAPSHGSVPYTAATPRRGRTPPRRGQAAPAARRRRYVRQSGRFARARRRARTAAAAGWRRAVGGVPPPAARSSLATGAALSVRSCTSPPAAPSTTPPRTVHLVDVTRRQRRHFRDSAAAPSRRPTR